MSLTTLLLAKETPEPKIYNETTLKRNFDAFIESIDESVISKGYPKAIKKLLSGDYTKQIQALNTLTETGEIEVIPWIILFLDSKDKSVSITAGLSLDKLISSNVLKRRDMDFQEEVFIKRISSKEKDLSPMAWIILKMLRQNDDGNTHAYAISMARYLNLNIFRAEIQNCLQSKHPAVSNQAKWAIEELNKQKIYEKGLWKKKVFPKDNVIDLK